MREEDLARDRDVRMRAFEWLSQRVSEEHPWITWQELLEFKYSDPQGRALANRPQGIWKPADLVGALSLKTRPPEKRTDRTFNYEDSLARDGLVAYKMQDTNETHNGWVRAAKMHQLPLIYLMGQRQSTYIPIFPVYVEDIDEERREFLIDLSQAGSSLQADLGYSEHPVEYGREYTERLVRQRLHQPAFRSAVMLAYREACAMCSLRHLKLLDAAHIKPDSQGGEARVSNGIAFCKIHHTAFDTNFLSIDPDYKIHVRADLLNEVDGPMLKYGIQEFHGKKLNLPRRLPDRPDRELLSERFEVFKESAT